MIARTDPVPIGRPSFLASPRCGDLAALAADLAIVGVPFTTPDDLERSRAACSPAPGAIREQSSRLAGSLGHYDFELGGELFAGRRVTIVDGGDVAMLPGRYEENSRATTAVIGTVLERGAVPIVLGGDQAATIPVVGAYAGRGPLCVVRIGADLDWRDEVNGVRAGPNSAMRRVSELPWVTSMIQVGLRGLGSSRRREVDDAQAFGSVLVRAEELHEMGVEKVLHRAPPAASYYVSLDAGGLDPAIAPGVQVPAFGGLTYFEVTKLLQAIVRRGPVVGLDVVGIVPDADLFGMTSLLAARLILNLAGALAHERRIGVLDTRVTAVRATAPPALAVVRELVGSRKERTR